MKKMLRIFALLLIFVLATGCTVDEKVGTVQGTITWQYNRVVGTKGDVNASVALIPSTLDKNLDNKAFTVILSQNPQGQHGIYTTNADGYGHYTLSDIPAGEYYLLFISRNAKGYGEADKISLLATHGIKPLFSDDEWESLERKLFLCKHEVRFINIESGKTIIESHDFGFTVW